MTSLNPDILAQILLMQTVLSKLPSETMIVDFIGQGLKDVPGVKIIDSCHDEPDDESPTCRIIPIKTEGRAVVWICLELSDPELFAGYEPFLRNFGVMVGMMIDKLRQKQAIELMNLELSISLELQRKLHSELVLKEKIASLSPMSMVLAHELNTPVGNIVTLSTSLADRTRALKEAVPTGLGRQELLKYFEMVEQATGLIGNSAQVTIDLVRRFQQTISNRADNHRQVFALEDLVRDTIKLVQSAVPCNNVTIDCKIESNLELDSYPGALGQVLEHLLMNAVRHGFPDERTGRIFVKAYRKGDQMETLLVVQDDGQGIPAENQSRVFEPFFTTSFGQGGSGLGLSIVYHVVTDILGGTISLESQPGQGSVFSLNIPLLAQSAA